MTGAEIAIVVVGVALAFASGWYSGRRSNDEFIESTADVALTILREQQAGEGIDSLRSLPPMVTAADAVEHATRTGLSVPEAAEALYRDRVRAVIEDRLRRRRTRPGDVR